MATQKLQIYHCELCGNTVEVIDGKAGTLTCCKQPMNLLTAKTADAANEKHVPVIEVGDCKCGSDCCGPSCKRYEVTVGSTLHPMTEEHYIQWIELVADGNSYMQFLKPGDAPKASFCCVSADQVVAREHCNVHGLWKA